MGVLTAHPLLALVRHLHEHIAHQAPLALTQTILSSFSLQIWPQTAFFIIIGIIVGGALGRLYQRLEEHRLSYQARLQALVGEMSLLEERERRRLATELHEEVGQILAITQVKLGLLTSKVNSPAELSTLKEVREHVHKSIQYIRSLTGELSPPVLYDLGFAPAVEWLAAKIRDQYGIELEVQQHPIDWPPCNDSQILLFVMVRDLLTYVARQARPQEIKILMQPERNNLRLQVEHDGVGINDAGSDSPAFALFSIRERLDRIGGTIEMQSPPGRGMVITLRVPLWKNTERA